MALCKFFCLSCGFIFWLQIDRYILKHTTTLFSLSDHYILSREWRVIIDQVQTNYHGKPIWCYNQSGMTELLIIRDPHYARMCFKSVKILGALHSYLWKRPRPSASAFSTDKNVELLGLYPIHNVSAVSTLGHCFNVCVLWQGTSFSNASHHSGVNEYMYIVRHLWQCVL